MPSMYKEPGKIGRGWEFPTILTPRILNILIGNYRGFTV
jgi:hypothetical protein